jgi:hypothetical protein
MTVNKIHDHLFSQQSRINFIAAFDMRKIRETTTSLVDVMLTDVPVSILVTLSQLVDQL